MGFQSSANFMVKIQGSSHFNSTIGYFKGVTVNLAAGTYSGSFVSGTKVIGTGSGTLTSIEWITASDGDDSLTGSSHDEFFKPLRGEDTVDGGGGWDILRYDHSEPGDQHGINVDYTLHKLNDTGGKVDEFYNIEHVIGSPYRDKFKGDGGQQTFTGGVDKDHFDGGAGIDTVNYSYETGNRGVVVDLVNKVAYDTFGHTDTFVRIENIKGTKFGDSMIGDGAANDLQGRDGNDSLSGGGGNDRISGDTDAKATTGFRDILRGDAGKDTIYGGGGNDTIFGGKGNDLLYGGAGNDQYDASDRTEDAVIKLVEGTAQFGSEKDKLNTFEDVRGGSGDDLIVGDKNANDLDGYFGNDTISGGLGFDTMFGGSGIDAVDYRSSTLAIMASLADQYVEFNGVTGIERIRGFEQIFGSDLDDTLEGDRKENRLDGNDGNDRLDGLGGDDDLAGGNGADTVNGGGGDDFVGGGAGSDNLYGDSGHDQLSGDGGKDSLTGGAGRDYFFFNKTTESAVGANRDVITDFRRNEKDRIGLEGIDADTSKGGDQDFHFIGGANFSSTRNKHVYGELRFKDGIVSGDVNGDGRADFQIAVTGVTKMVELDFFL